MVARHIRRLKREHYFKLIDRLKKEETVSITTDFWSDIHNRSFLVLTTHSCSETFELKSEIIDFSSFPYRHTAVEITRIVTRKLMALNIFHKVNRIVCDGAPNLVRAISLMNINAERVWCIAHRLHLLIASGLALWPKKKKKNADNPTDGKLGLCLDSNDPLWGWWSTR